MANQKLQNADFPLVYHTRKNGQMQLELFAQAISTNYKNFHQGRHASSPPMYFCIQWETFKTFVYALDHTCTRSVFRTFILRK